MKIDREKVNAEGLKFSVSEEYRRFFFFRRSKEIARAYLYILPSDSPFSYHAKPFGFMTGVYVEPSKRGHGYGTAVIKELIETARESCYKLITTSRDDNTEVHKLYIELGFGEFGKEFRMNFQE